MAEKQMNIAVAGAGIMGLSAAFSLREHNVTLFDLKGFPASNASAMAGGMLAPWSEIEHLPGDFLEAAIEGITIWQEILPGLKSEVEFHRSGSLLLSHPEDDYILARLASKIPPSECQTLNQRQIRDLEPDLTRFAKALYLPLEAHIHPQQALQALGHEIPERKKEEAKLEPLRTQFDWVIDCRGYAAETDDPELRGVKGEMLVVRNPEFSLSRPVRLMHPRYPLYIVPRPGRIFMIGATVLESADEQLSVKSALELLSAAYSLHPSFAESEILEMKAGIRPAYADNLPRIKIEGNMIRCNGLFRHGYLLAPVMAACVADFIAGRENKFISLFTRGKNEYHHQRPEEKHKRHA